MADIFFFPSPFHLFISNSQDPLHKKIFPTVKFDGTNKLKKFIRQFHPLIGKFEHNASDVDGAFCHVPSKYAKMMKSEEAIFLCFCFLFLHIDWQEHQENSHCYKSIFLNQNYHVDEHTNHLQGCVCSV